MRWRNRAIGNAIARDCGYSACLSESFPVQHAAMHRGLNAKALRLPPLHRTYVALFLHCFSARRPERSAVWQAMKTKKAKRRKRRTRDAAWQFFEHGALVLRSREWHAFSRRQQQNVQQIRAVLKSVHSYPNYIIQRLNQIFSGLNSSC